MHAEIVLLLLRVLPLLLAGHGCRTPPDVASSAPPPSASSRIPSAPPQCTAPHCPKSVIQKTVSQRGKDLQKEKVL